MSNKDEHNDKKAEAEYNVFRDSTLRYMGYANEIGESFRYQVSAKPLYKQKTMFITSFYLFHGEMNANITTSFANITFS